MPMDPALVLPELVRSRGEADDRLFLQEVGGSEWTYAETHRRALQWASALESLGVGPEDGVATLLPNRNETVACWVGIGWLRAYEVAVNPAYRGRILSDVTAHSGAIVAVVAERFVDRLL